MLAASLCFGGGFLIGSYGVHVHSLALLYFGYGFVGGIGLGIDRLVMLFTGAGIRETILFPLLKPEGH